MNKNLQSLRGISAILIFFHHFLFSSNVVTSFGDFGVTFFMMLSGFVCYVSTFNKVNKNNFSIPHWFDYNYTRWSKIYPTYLICWIAALIIFPDSGSILGKGLGLFALQSWSTNSDIYFCGNSVAWFISDLFFCQLLFIPIFKELNFHTTSVFRYIVVYYMVYLAIVLFVPGKFVHPIVYICPIMQFSNFLGGMILGRLYVRRTEKNSVTCYTILQISIIVVIVVQMILYKYIPTRFSYGSYWWVTTALCIYVFAQANNSTNIINKFLHHRVLILAGNLSFCFYLLHYICIRLCYKMDIVASTQTSRLLESIILIPVIFGLSYLLNKFFSVPISNKLNRRKPLLFSPKHRN